MNKLLIVIDMQNDFVTGALANVEAQKIVPAMAEYIRNFDGDIYATRDTHYADYMDTQEGKNLPVPHCIEGTEGHEIVPEILEAFEDREYIFDKPTFGSVALANDIGYLSNYDEIEICGVCTDICVISNALLIKAVAPEIKIKVLKDLCAGVTPESHENALKAMAACQIEVV